MPQPTAMVTSSVTSSPSFCPLTSGRMSWNDGYFLDAVPEESKYGLEENSDQRMMIDPRMEQDPGNRSAQSRMFQRLMQAKQEGIRGMPPTPRNLSVEQQMPVQQQQQQQPPPTSPNPFYAPPPADPQFNPYGAPAGYPPSPYGFNPYYPPPPPSNQPGKDLSAEQQQYMMWMMMQQQQYPPAYYPPPPGAEGFAQGPPPGYFLPPPPPPAFGYPGYYPPQQPTSQQQPINKAQPELPVGAPPLPPISELIGTNAVGVTPSRVAEADSTDSSNPAHTKKRQPDKIANTSDLYLETLKLDTATRQRARIRGDIEEANAVFKDPRIKQLKEQLKPYLESSARIAAKETSKLIETSEEEILIRQQLLQQQMDAKKNDPSNSGLNYRELMKRRMSGKMDEKADNQSENPIPTPNNVASQEYQQQGSISSALETPSALLEIQQTSQDPILKSTDDETTARSNIRTLMGLLLKHRGGPGFGSGRLKSASDIDKYDQMLSLVVDLLKKESSPINGGKSSTANDRSTFPKNMDDDVSIPALKNELNPPHKSTDAYSTTLDLSLTDLLQTIASYRDKPSPDLLLSLKNSLTRASEVCSDDSIVGATDRSAVDAAPQSSREVLVHPSKQAVKIPSAADNDSTMEISDNRRILENALSTMNHIAGDSKYGIRSGLSNQEAKEAANSLQEMRRVLMEELNS